MMQSLPQIKARLGVEPEALGMTDRLTREEAARSGSISDWDLYLADTVAGTTELLSQWTGVDLSRPDVLASLDAARRASLRRAEILLIKAEIVLDYGFVEATDPGDIQAGGSEGVRISQRRLTVSERGDVASELRGRARTLVLGQQDTFEGVE
ncbi:MAG: hypothetical protein CVV45_17975 [Spirochaetae bacterium HGW-Spirochaetae-10]|nr:MAG: hypothetical protein CVV45_17975 [Spirochaetae bacterium HGW-Spirochaetae-10]